jgi:hypothetical protein
VNFMHPLFSIFQLKQIGYLELTGVLEELNLEIEVIRFCVKG